MFKQTKKALLLSVLMLVVCLSMLLGTTYAWFTDSASSDANIIQTGNLDINVEYTLDGKTWVNLDGATNLFQKDLWEPGHTEVVALKIENKGNLTLKYTALMNILGETTGKTKDGKDIKLSEILQVSKVTQQADMIGDILLGLIFNGGNNVDKGSIVAFNQSKVLEENKELFPNDAHYLIITVDMPETIGNEANHDGKNIPTIQFGINVLAAQYAKEEDSFGKDYDKDAEYPTMTDTWDGTTNISWYLDDPDATEYSLSTSEDFAGLAKLIDEGTDFAGKTIKLENNLDLNNKIFEPIGSYRQDKAFNGTFDGQGHTILNLSQNTWDLNNGYYHGDLGLGLFGKVEDAVIKNLIMENVSISGEYGLCGTVAATAFGECTFENITINNAKVNDYLYYAGGVVGWASGKHTYQDITIDESTIIGGQWGDFGNANGGIIGGIDTDGEYLFKDCVIACRIDGVNDVVSAYQWYCYRNCGMIVGKVSNDTSQGARPVVVPAGVKCENVTVIYNDWANYHYCEFAGTGYPYVRVEAGTSVDAYTNVRYGHPTDANGNIVVDDNHVHNDGEDHMKLIVFDQLFGGPGNDRYANYGVAEYDGVKVIYNNK